MGQMDLVNYWEDVRNPVCTWYLDSTFASHSQSNDPLEHFLLGLQSLNKAKLIQVFIDGPNVNWAFFEDLRKFQDENDMNKLRPAGCCGLHSIHLAFKIVENSTDWRVKKILKAVFQILHDSLARHGGYIEVARKERFPLPFCGTGWIEDQKVALRAIKIWDNVYQICRFRESLPKSKRQSCKSYQTVLTATKDPLTLAIFHFFALILNYLSVGKVNDIFYS